GQLAWEKLHAENMTEFEFFMELRVNSVEQLGQVRLAILETNGQISVFYYPDEEVRAGVSILPTHCTARYTKIPQEGIYA
ncbi:DUF421 domain-containing protein, partial [Escherichia coli]|nr:DUF421 domain-containing protein [Escherichia coli]